MQTWYRVAAAAIGWFVIGLQYYLIASKPDVGLAEARDPHAVLLHHPYQHPPNILVALAMALPWLAPESRISGVLLASLGANGDRLLHHRRLGGLLRDPAQALESGRLAISRRYD